MPCLRTLQSRQRLARRLNARNPLSAAVCGPAGDASHECVPAPSPEDLLPAKPLGVYPSAAGQTIGNRGAGIPVSKSKVLSGLEKQFLWAWQALQGPELVQEHAFHPVRKWRFDFAHAPSKVAIELEGGTWSASRHTTGAGFRRDCEKYNAAVLLGWRVFRLTTDMIRVAVLAPIRHLITEAGP